MLLQKNLLECLTIFSGSGAVICVLLNYITNISPITGAWFLAYIFIVFVVSVSLSFKFLQWLLHLNRPIKYDLDGLSKEYPYLSSLFNILPRPQKRPKQECKEYDTNELSIITTVLERKLVSSWYVPYISQEIGFPFACKQMLDQMIGKCFQICNKIETKDVFVDVCAIFIGHIKEYKKALKRLEKSPNSTIEELYKKSHCVSNPDKEVSSAEHCTDILRVVLKELVPWELWDTPQSELLVRILAKKLDNFVESTLANPAWLNDKLITALKGKDVKVEVVDKKEAANLKEEIVNETKEEINVNIPEKKVEKPTVESALTTLINKTTAPILQRAINEEISDDFKRPVESINIEEELPVKTAEPVDIKASPVMRQKRGRQGRNEVKIYDRIIEGSVKTWETDIDLQCISLGQDLLASLDGEITLSRLWGQDAEPEGSPNPPRAKSPQPLWFGEEDAIELELESPQQRSPVHKELSPKPAELLKDLQTTVHQAKTKIGDLQVPNVNIDVPRKQYSGVLAAVSFYAHGSYQKSVGSSYLFNMSQPTFSRCLHEVTDALNHPEILRAHIKFPSTREERESIMERFMQKFGFPGTIGCIDGTHVALIRPTDHEETFFNRKNYHSLNVLIDEAAGMMEGLLDFGIAGLKKGLRLTGLSDDSQEKSPSHMHKERPADRPSPPEARRPAPAPPPSEPKEIISSVIQKDDNGLNSVPPLLKQQRVISQDSVPWQARVLAGADSPEPEYEEAADLSTSIAKLRCLLQRADTSPKAEEAWWESQRPQSSRPIDTATLADEYDMSAERGASPGQASNNMQRLDKLFQRTVTGVFNSIKTAVGAEGEAAPPQRDWAYVTTSIELSVGGAVARLVGSRRALSHVDCALDSLRQLPAPTPAPPAPPPDDLEEWCSSCGAAWSACSELCCAAAAPNSAAHRIATVLLADLTESLIEAWLDDLSAWARSQVFAVFEQMDSRAATASPLPPPDLDRTADLLMEKLPTGNDPPRESSADQGKLLIEAWLDDLSAWARSQVFAVFEQMDSRAAPASPLPPPDLDRTANLLMEKLPTALHVFGAECLSGAVRLCIQSAAHAQINRDVAFRLLAALALHFKRAAALRNPSFDAN